MPLFILVVGISMIWIGATRRAHRVTMPNALPWVLQGWTLVAFGFVLTLGALAQLLV